MTGESWIILRVNSMLRKLWQLYLSQEKRLQPLHTPCQEETMKSLTWTGISRSLNRAGCRVGSICLTELNLYSSGVTGNRIDTGIQIFSEFLSDSLKLIRCCFTLPSANISCCPDSWVRTLRRDSKCTNEPSWCTSSTLSWRTNVHGYSNVADENHWPT